jgi:hypothetical protein
MSEESQVPDETEYGVHVIQLEDGRLIVQLTVEAGDTIVQLRLLGETAVGLGEALGSAGKHAATGLVVPDHVPPGLIE